MVDLALLPGMQTWCWSQLSHHLCCLRFATFTLRQGPPLFWLQQLQLHLHNSLKSRREALGFTTVVGRWIPDALVRAGLTHSLRQGCGCSESRRWEGWSPRTALCCLWKKRECYWAGNTLDVPCKQTLLPPFSIDKNTEAYSHFFKPLFKPEVGLDESTGM